MFLKHRVVYTALFGCSILDIGSVLFILSNTTK